MAELEEPRKKLQPLLFNNAADKDGVSTRAPFPEDTCESYVVSMLGLAVIIRHLHSLASPFANEAGML
jgi:hypothetical protein